MKPEQKAKNQGHMQALNRMAGEINAKLASANASEKLAQDTRLSAAIMLAEAEKTCKLAGIKFKEWCAKNLDKSWETARKLAAIGASPDPVVALEQTRTKNAEQTKAKRHAAATAPKNAATNSAGIALPKGNSMPKNDPLPYDIIKRALDGMPKDTRTVLLRGIAQEYGFTLQPVMPITPAIAPAASVVTH